MICLRQIDVRAEMVVAEESLTVGKARVERIKR